jgi:hypothetical protein
MRCAIPVAPSPKVAGLIWGLVLQPNKTKADDAIKRTLLVFTLTSGSNLLQHKRFARVYGEALSFLCQPKQVYAATSNGAFVASGKTLNSSYLSR